MAFKILGAFAFTSVLAFSAQAAEAVYNCKTVHGSGADGWIMPQYVFYIDAEKGEARVLDNIVQYYHDGPVSAKITSQSSKAIRLRWTVENVSASSGVKDQDFKAILRPGRGKFSVEPDLAAFDNSPRGEGVCAIEK